MQQRAATLVIESTEVRKDEVSVKTALSQPVELTQEQLLQVMGGLGPNGNWTSDATASGPNGNW